MIELKITAKQERILKGHFPGLIKDESIKIDRQNANDITAYFFFEDPRMPLSEILGKLEPNDKTSLMFLIRKIAKHLP
jgi:hypothetical protein